MQVRRIGFLGTRTANVDEMTAFVRDVLGLPGGRTDPDWTISRLPTHRFDFVEVYGPSFDDPRVCPPGVNGPFVAFVVDDVVAAFEEVQAAAVEVLSEIVWAQQAFANDAYEGAGWFFVRAPDGHAYVIEQVPD